jgi:hypothetical protein
MYIFSICNGCSISSVLDLDPRVLLVVRVEDQWRRKGMCVLIMWAFVDLYMIALLVDPV